MSRFKGGRSFRFVAGKPSNREVQRQAKRAIEMGFRAHAMLVACLVQRGGEMAVTQGTIDQVNEKIARLGWEAQPNPNDPKELIVRIVEGAEPVEGGRLE